MVDKLIWKVVLSFLLTQIEKFGVMFDAKKFMAGAEQKIRDFVPGRFFDDDAVSAVTWAAERLDKILEKTSALEEILQELKDKDWAGALEALKRLLLEGVADDDKHAVSLTAA